MKTTLTDLLNSEPVKRDIGARTWTRTRLMEVEQGLKMQRRSRRSSSSVIDEDRKMIADAIGERLEES